MLSLLAEHWLEEMCVHMHQNAAVLEAADSPHAARVFTAWEHLACRMRHAHTCPCLLLSDLIPPPSPRDGTLRLWDLNTGATTRRFVGHTKDVLSVAFSVDNRQVGKRGCAWWGRAVWRGRCAALSAVKGIFSSPDTSVCMQCAY